MFQLIGGYVAFLSQKIAKANLTGTGLVLNRTAEA
jgi:hypothetical protein